MRFVTWLAGGTLALGLTTMAFADDAAPPPPDSAPHWCGFHDKAGANVSCGYSKFEDCKKALGDGKDAVCVPDPAFG
jgi:hypothetical protein